MLFLELDLRGLSPFGPGLAEDEGVEGHFEALSSENSVDELAVLRGVRVVFLQLHHQQPRLRLREGKLFTLVHLPQVLPLSLLALGDL